MVNDFIKQELNEEVSEYQAKNLHEESPQAEEPAPKQ